jgi:flagellar protein FlaG
MNGGETMGVEMIGSVNEQLAFAVAQRKRSGKEEVVRLAGREAAEPIPGLPSGGGKAYLNEALEKLKTIGDIFNRRLDFEVDEDTNRVIVKVIDTKTDKVIKEIPPEQLVQLAAKIQEMIGLLVDEER